MQQITVSMPLFLENGPIVSIRNGKNKNKHKNDIRVFMNMVS